MLGELDGKNVTVREGRFGPYIKYGSVNARLPLAYRDMPHECTLEDAIDAVREKQAQDGGGARKSKTKTAAKYCRILHRDSIAPSLVSAA